MDENESGGEKRDREIERWRKERTDCLLHRHANPIGRKRTVPDSGSDYGFTDGNVV